MDNLKSKVTEKKYDVELEQRITTAISRAVKRALMLHKQTGHPIYVSEDGEVKKIEAKDIQVELDIVDAEY